MSLYRIWTEGDPPVYLGCAEAESFQEACKQFFRKKEQYHEDTNTFWGKKLFQSKAEACNQIPNQISF